MLTGRAWIALSFWSPYLVKPSPPFSLGPIIELSTCRNPQTTDVVD
jgi:hypothetical protein